MQNGILIAQLRTKKGISQDEMAQWLNIGLTTYKSLEANARPMSIQTLNDLSNYFRVTLNALLGLSQNLKEVDPFDIDYKYLRFSLKYVRRRNRVTQKELAQDLSLSVSSIAQYEKHPEKLNAYYLYRFAQRFHVSVDYICGKTLKKEVL